MVKINILDAIDKDLEGEKIIEIIKPLGAGAYGSVYLTNLDNLVIKLFETAADIDKISLEYKIFKKLLDYSSNYPDNLVKGIGRGQLLTSFDYDDNEHQKGDYFILIPYYKRFYDVHTSRQKLRNKQFILDFITDLLKVSIFLEKELQYIDLDIKTSNIMYDGDKMVLIDLGLIEKIQTGKEIFVPDRKYFIWPHETCYLVVIPVYSIAICVMEFFFGKLKVWKIASPEEVELYANNLTIVSKTIGNILKKMISLKYDSDTVLKYIQIKYKANLEINDKDLEIKIKKVEPKRKKKPVNKWYANLLNNLDVERL